MKFVNDQIFDFLQSIRVCSYNFSSRLCWLGGFNKDPTISLDRARPPPKYVYKNNMSLTNLKIWPAETLRENMK
jgi:hypothetical protein